MSAGRARGQPAFAEDVALAGTLHLALRRSPHARARVGRIDASAARALPGVAAVLTAADCPGLLPSEPRFVGDRLAVAAAEEPELARRAAETIEIALEPLAPVLDAAAAAEDPANVVARLSLATGDVEAALATADAVVGGEWRLPFTPAVALEPPTAATWLDEDGRLVVRTSSESPFLVRAVLARRLPVPAAAIRVMRPRLAGGGAGRSDVVAEDLCAMVTLLTGRPARLTLGAEEALTAAADPAQRVRVRLALREGRISAIDLALLVDVGAAESAHELLSASARHAFGLYRAPALRVEALAVRTNRPPAGRVRTAEGAAAFALECAVEDAALREGQDPAAFRRTHLRAPGEPGAEILVRLGEPEGRDDSRALAALLGPGPSVPRGRRWPASPAAARYGTGIGVARRAGAALGAAGPAASFRLLEDGSFHLVGAVTGAADELAAAAAWLSVTPDRIIRAAGDTDSAAFDGADPWLAAFAGGLAVEAAARRAGERIREAGAQVLRVAVPDARLESGAVVERGGHSVTFAEIGAAALREGQPLTATAAAPAAAADPAFAAARAEVEVDLETGLVRVIGLRASLAGPSPAPATEALVEGSLALAIERAVAGGLTFDAEGRPLCGFRSWPLVAATDLPPLSVSFVAAADAGTRPGAAALADVAGRAALAAIVNAVAAATGARVRSLPLTPAAVLDAASAG